MSPAPDLSVIVPARDAAPTLRAALDSILAGADRLLEVVVVDDASSDATAAIAGATDPRVRVITGRGRGPAAARNDGIRAAQGRLIAFLDADDEWVAATPDPRRALLDADPGSVAVGQSQVVLEGGPVVAPAVLQTFGEVMLTRQLALAHPLDESLVRGEDLEWFLRVRDAGVAVQLADAVVTSYHRRPGSLSHDSTTGLLAGLHATIRRRAEQAAQ